MHASVAWAACLPQACYSCTNQRRTQRKVVHRLQLTEHMQLTLYSYSCTQLGCYSGNVRSDTTPTSVTGPVMTCDYLQLYDLYFSVILWHSYR